MIVLFSFIFATCNSLEENLLWALNPDNFRASLDYQPRMLVLFWSPSSDDSQKIYAEGKLAAKKLNTHLIRLASIDCDSFQPLCAQYNLSQTPQYLYFDGNDYYEYKGSMYADDIFNWVLPRFKSSLEYIKESDDIYSIFRSNRISFLYLGNHTETLKIFKNLSIKFIDVKFYVSDIDDHKELFRRSSEFVLHKGGELTFYMGESENDQLERFLDNNKPVRILDFNEDTIKLVFDQKKTTLFLFRKDLERNKFVDFGKIADRYEGKFVFVAADLNAKGKNINKLAHALGLNPNTQPIAVILSIKETFNKYRTASTDFEGLNDFINSYYSGTLLQYYKSEAIPTDAYDNGILEIVGLNHDETVNNANKDVLALYYTVQHPESTNILPIFQKLALNYQSIPDMQLVKMDIVFNEAKNLLIPQLPLIKFYPKHNKAGIPYSGDLSLFGLQSFVLAQLKASGSDL